MGGDGTAHPDAVSDGRSAARSAIRQTYLRFSGSGFAPPPNGFGGTATPFSPGGALLAGFGLAELAGLTLPGGARLAGALATGCGGRAAETGTGGAGGAVAGGAVAAPAPPTPTPALRPGFAAPPRGPSSLALMTIAPAVPTTTQSPRSARHTRRPRLAFVATGSGYETRDGDVGRAGTAPVKT